MYYLEDVRDVHLEVTSKCQASCPMCPRRIQGGQLNPSIQLEEITLDIFKEWLPLSFIKQLDSLFMCGNLGDPIVARDTLEIYQYIRNVNPEITLCMHTNGSGKDKEWWKQIAKAKVRVKFGIDGLEDTHHLYRISTNYNKIISNATTFIQAGGDAEWHMLVFEHNEHQINRAKATSQALGFDLFDIKHTSRFKSDSFQVLGHDGSQLHKLRPSEKSKAMISKVRQSQSETNPNISCKALNNPEGKQIYISACGNVTPCCWLDNLNFTSLEYKSDYISKVKRFPSLKTDKLEDIFDSGYFTDVEQTWSLDPLLMCKRQCGSFDREGAQHHYE